MSDDGYALSEGDFSPSSVASLDSILRSQVYSPEVDSPLVRDDDLVLLRERGVEVNRDNREKHLCIR